MYYQSYEEYMRDVLGYPREATYNDYYGINQRNMIVADEEIEKLYPEIYRVVYPMVCKACNQYKGEITEDLVSRLTDEVYSNLEVENEVRGEEKPKAKTETRVSTTSKTVSASKEVETRQRRLNNNLRDLIRILILRELINRPGRPPFPGEPRPPMPRNHESYDVHGYYNNLY